MKRCSLLLFKYLHYIPDVPSWPVKPKIFTLWLFIEQISRLLFRMIVSSSNLVLRPRNGRNQTVHSTEGPPRTSDPASETASDLGSLVSWPRAPLLLSREARDNSCICLHLSSWNVLHAQRRLQASHSGPLSRGLTLTHVGVDDSRLFLQLRPEPSNMNLCRVPL